MTAALSDPPAAASAEEFDRAEARTAHNYHPLPVCCPTPRAPG